jgi:hypothetical protein
VRIRFYRGPMDGKVHEGRDDCTVVTVSNMPALAFQNVQPGDYNAPVNMKNTNYYRTPHTHPDGSVFFEWGQPKGTRIK